MVILPLGKNLIPEYIKNNILRLKDPYIMLA